MFSFHKTNNEWDAGHLKSILKTAANGIVIVDANGIIIDFNSAAENIFGYLLEEVLGKNLEMLMHQPLPVNILNDAETRSNKTANVQIIDNGYEIKGRKKDGTIFPLHFAVNEIRANGEVYFTCVVRDLTKTKKTEDELMFSQAYLTAIVENTNEAIWSVDKNYNLMAYNSVFKYLCQKYLGLELKIGEKIIDISQNNRYQHFYKYYERALMGEYFSTDEYFSVKEEERYFEANFNPIRGKSGIEGVSVFLKEITARKQAQIELEAANKKIKEINDEYDTFVYRASHDIRGPLASIQGLIDVFKLEAKEPRASKLIDMLEERTSKLNEILTVLADTTAMKQQPIELFPINIASLIEGYKLHKSDLLNNGNIEFIIESKHNGFFYTDEKLIKNIVYKILDNAFNYRDKMKEKSYVNLKIEYIDKALHMTFSDNGIGIHPAQVSKVFDMFHRGTERSKGAGLGLYITKKSVEKLNGEIHIDSQYAIGTHVNVILPDIK